MSVHARLVCWTVVLVGRVADEQVVYVGACALGTLGVGNGLGGDDVVGFVCRGVRNHCFHPGSLMV